jgi:aminoglycoside phosphotransferase (APT) family kinase protein
MPHVPNLTPDDLAALCERTFPDRREQQLEAMMPINSRQHEVVAFQLRWKTAGGQRSEALIARRYISTISWWRPNDLGKAQREATVSRWLHEQGFPVPAVYAREIGVLGDVVLFALLAGHDWSVYRRSFRDVIHPLAGEFARLLAGLHSLNPPESVRSVVPTVTLPTALANLTALAQQIGLAELVEAVERTMTLAFNVPEAEPVLLHGDYHFSNALLYEGKIIGIVDWEYCALGDPRWDVANAYMQLVDFDAAKAAETFLETYLRHSGRQFEGPPVYNVVAPLQQWAISEWLVQQEADGHPLSFALAHDLIALRDVHRRRAQLAMRWLDN